MLGEASGGDGGGGAYGGGSILRGLVLRGGEVGGCGDGYGVDARVDGPLQYLHDTAEGWRSKDSRGSRN